MRKKLIISAGVLTLLCFGAISWFVHLHHEPLDAVCIDNLRCIDGAKLQWALENFSLPGTNGSWAEDYMRYFNAVASEEDVHLYNSRNQYPMPRCPRGGKYSIGRVIDPPTCSYPGHALPKSRDLIPEFVYSTLVDAYDAGASEVVIGTTPENAPGTPIRCKIGDVWYEAQIPTYLRQRVISELQREARVSLSQFPNDGDLIIACMRVRLRWRLRMNGPDTECRIIAPAGPEPSEEKDSQLSNDWWPEYTNVVRLQVAAEALGNPPPFNFSGNWQEFWERRMKSSRRWHLNSEKQIDYIKSERLKVGLDDYEWSL